MKIVVEIDDRHVREDIDHAYESAITRFAEEWKRRTEGDPDEKSDAELLNAALLSYGVRAQVMDDFTWPTRYHLAPEVQRIAEAVFAEREVRGG